MITKNFMKMLQSSSVSNMMNFYSKLQRETKIFFWLAILALVVYLALMPLYFFGLDKGYQYPNGWLLGSIVSLFAYFTLIKMSNALTMENSKRSTPLVVLSSFLRPLLYVLVLGVSGVCTFKPEWFGGFDMFSFWTSFAALLPMPAVILIGHLINANKQKKNNNEER